MDSTTVRLIAGVIAVLFGVVIFMRRRSTGTPTDTEKHDGRAQPAPTGNPMAVSVVGFHRPPSPSTAHTPARTPFDNPRALIYANRA